MGIHPVDAPGVTIHVSDDPELEPLWDRAVVWFEETHRRSARTLADWNAVTEHYNRLVSTRLARKEA